MRNKENIQNLLTDLQSRSDKPIIFDENAIENAYQKKEDHQSLPIKILSVFGGLLACAVLMGFIFVSNLFESETAMLIFGSACILGALVLNRMSNKIITDTISVSSYLAGFLLLGIALSELLESESVVCMIILLIAILALSALRNYILSFVTILIINAAVLALISISELQELIYVYTAVIAIITTLLFLNEVKIMMFKNKVSRIYGPLRSAFVFTFLGMMIYSNHYKFWEISPVFIWLTSGVFILAILYVVSMLFSILKITASKHKIVICIATALLLTPTIYSPAISGSILIILLSFFVSYKTAFALGIVAFIYSISMYYYDLGFTLLTKSIILFSCGILFLLIYLFTHKKLTTNEKV